MTTERDSDKPTSNVDDVLTEIKYLAKAAERDLHSIGIRRFDDLIQYTPEELAKRLYEQTKNGRYTVTFITKNDWIGQAKRKVDERKQREAASQRAGAETEQTDSAARKRLEGWDSHAGFSLYFENRAAEQGEKAWQTRVWLIYKRGRERDTEKTFEGIRPEPWVRWIFEQAELPGDAGMELIEQTTAAPPAPVTPSPTQVSIVRVELERSNKDLAASVRFTISGADAETLTAERTRYQILLLTVDQERQLRKFVASTHGLFQPAESEYAHQIAFPFPDVGRYQLQTIVLVESQIGLMAIHHGPTVTIIP